MDNVGGSGFVLPLVRLSRAPCLFCTTLNAPGLLSGVRGLGRGCLSSYEAALASVRACGLHSIWGHKRSCCRWPGTPGGQPRRGCSPWRVVLGSEHCPVSAELSSSQSPGPALFAPGTSPQLGGHDGLLLLHPRALVPPSCILGSLAPFAPHLQKAQHPHFLSLVFPVSMTSVTLVFQHPHFILEGSVAPTSCLGDGSPPPFLVSQYFFPGELVADSGLGSGHLDLSLDGPRAVPEASLSPLSGHRCAGGVSGSQTQGAFRPCLAP